MKSLRLFYILVLYVFLQFCWWAYLLVDLNKEVYNNKIAAVMYNTEDPDTQDETALQLEKEMHAKWWMVIGEGMVFVSLLGFGAYRTLKAFKKEVALNKQQKNFLLSVTHEFKSPLASIKLSLQTIQKRELEKEKVQHLLNNAVSDTDRLDKLVENALLATRIENDSITYQKEELNLSELVNDIISKRSSSNKIENNITPELFISGDSLAITSLFLNLLDNAEKYSDPESPVSVELITEKQRARLSVKDLGIGISDEEKKNIFNKFYRVGNEEVRRTKGTGLGLYIAKHIIELHDAKLAIKDNYPKGTIFEVSFPLINN